MVGASAAAYAAPLPPAAGQAGPPHNLGIVSTTKAPSF